MVMFDFFFFKQKTAYEVRISDWSSDVCSSDLALKVKRLTCPGAVNVDVEPPPGPVTPCRSMLWGILLSGMLRRWNWIVSPWRTRMKLPGTVPPKVQKDRKNVV